MDNHCFSLSFFFFMVRCYNISLITFKIWFVYGYFNLVEFWILTNTMAMKSRSLTISYTRNMEVLVRFWWNHSQICYSLSRRRNCQERLWLHVQLCYGPKTMLIKTGNSGSPNGQNDCLSIPYHFYSKCKNAVGP